jgi:glyoxylase-like metal-dependent hydrolase (beta-lactamase superfamily II)
MSDVVRTYRDIEAAELAGRLGTDDEPFLLDVRERTEFAEWSIPGAKNVPLGELSLGLDDVPRDREVVVMCAAGGRSARAADLLTEHGLHVANLRGGMTSWAALYDWVVLELGDVRVVQVRRRGKGCLSYVVGAGSSAFVIDPSLAVDVYLEVAAEHSWTITDVFDTHLHADHLSGARELAARTGATLHLNPADTFDFEYEPLTDGARFALSDGAAMSVATLTTPGHTRGSTIYVIDDRAVITGDTLFVDGVGRPDLADRAAEFAHNLYRSLHDRVLTLPADALVLPGHYGDAVRVKPDEPVAATLRELRSTLPELGLDEDAFVSWAVERTTPRPPNYAEIIAANMGRAGAPVETLTHLESGPNRCSV